jgi:hypothetical protein
LGKEKIVSRRHHGQATEDGVASKGGNTLADLEKLPAESEKRGA